jgi:hypothetical protein
MKLTLAICLIVCASGAEASVTVMCIEPPIPGALCPVMVSQGHVHPRAAWIAQA